MEQLEKVTLTTDNIDYFITKIHGFFLVYPACVYITGYGYFPTLPKVYYYNNSEQVGSLFNGRSIVLHLHNYEKRSADIYIYFIEGDTITLCIQKDDIKIIVYKGNAIAQYHMFDTTIMNIPFN